MKKKWYGIYTGVIAGVLALTGIASVVSGAQDFSANENRYLTQFPHITLSGILAGDVQQDLTDAMNDQFVGRDFWTETTTQLKKCVGYRDVGGVYIGRDNYYFAKVMNQDISQTNYFQNLRFIRLASQMNADCQTYTLLVPSPGTILKEKLPAFATLYDSATMYQEAEQMLDGIEVVDIRKNLQQTAKKEQVYYRTDHHWTAAGAYVGYQALAKAMKWSEIPSYESFQVEDVSNQFFGTLYSKALDCRAVADTLRAPETVPETSVVCDGEKGSLYVKSQAQSSQKDKYAYFFGGNYGKVTIKTKSKTQQKLLVVKDSFANSMVPYLLEDYSEITMVDLRYLKESFQKLMQEYQPDQLLFLYEMSNFAQDENLNKITK